MISSSIIAILEKELAKHSPDIQAFIVSRIGNLVQLILKDLESKYLGNSGGE